jgi:nucleoside-diphosphate-sugar epimerase
MNYAGRRVIVTGGLGFIDSNLPVRLAELAGHVTIIDSLLRNVCASTRQVYDVPHYLPVDEDHPIQLIDFSGVHKAAATSYHFILSRTGVLDAVAVRLTNVYGPRMALDVVCQGFLSTFIHRAVLRGDGLQLCDPMYVSDAAEAFLAAGSATARNFRCFNAGGPAALSLAEIAERVSHAAGCPEPVFGPFPSERKPTDKTSLPSYLDPGEPSPVCTMPEHTGGRRHLAYVQSNGVHQ